MTRKVRNFFALSPSDSTCANFFREPYGHGDHVLEFIFGGSARFQLRSKVIGENLLLRQRGFLPKSYRFILIAKVFADLRESTTRGHPCRPDSTGSECPEQCSPRNHAGLYTVRRPMQASERPLRQTSGAISDCQNRLAQNGHIRTGRPDQSFPDHISWQPLNANSHFPRKFRSIRLYFLKISHPSLMRAECALRKNHPGGRRRSEGRC